MISISMVQSLLEEIDWSENKITKEIIIPALDSFSAKGSHRLKNIEFTGGASELGNDIQFYELIGPDNCRMYTGIQVKKGDIDQTQTTQLVIQGEQAFNKSIHDPSNHQVHRITRWVVASTGKITTPARKIVQEHAARHGKPVHFWSASKLAEIIHENYLENFLEKIGYGETFINSSNVIDTFYDPDEKTVLATDVNAESYVRVPAHFLVPPVVSTGIFIAVDVIGEKNPSHTFHAKANDFEVTASCMMSKISPIYVRTDESGCFDIKLLDTKARASVYLKGYRYTR